MEVTAGENFCCASTRTQTCWARLHVLVISTLQVRGENSQAASLAKTTKFHFYERPCLQRIRWEVIEDPPVSCFGITPTPISFCFPVSSSRLTLPYPEVLSLELIWYSFNRVHYFPLVVIQSISIDNRTLL